METKRCRKCGKEKSLNEFYIRTRSSDGLRSWCKKCEVDDSVRVHRSINGLVSKIYSHQKGTSIKNLYPPPSYSKKELKKWLLSNHNFNILYNDWVNSDYNSKLRPSVDRKDDYEGYSLDNIQLMTWRENNKKVHSDQINGINTKQCRAVLQYDLDGNLIKEYYSMNQASRETKISQGNISSVCRGITNTAHNFIWKYKN